MEVIKCEECGKEFMGHTQNQVNMQLMIHRNTQHVKRLEE